MRSIYTLLLLSGIIVGLTACAATPPVVPDRNELRPLPVDHAAQSTRLIPTSRVSMTTGTLTLSDAIETALLNNPGLQADFAAFEAAAQEVPQVSSLSDPFVSYTQFVDGVQTRVGEQEFVASVSQMFPWFGKLRLRGSLARTQAMQALEDYRSKMLDIRHQVEQAWFELAYEQSALALAREDKQTILQTLDAASALYGSGEQGRGVLLRSQTELARIENDLTGYPARIQMLREKLGRLLFVTEVGEVPLLDDQVDLYVALPESDVLISSAFAHRPEIERFRLGIEKAEIRYQLARKDYFPDFTVGLNYIGVGDRPDNPSGPMAPPDEGDDAWGVSVGFNIPIPNARRRAAKEQALRLREEAQLRRIAAESEVEEEVQSILPRLVSLNQQLTILRDNLLPLAEEAYATNQAAYTSGRATYLDLLDSQRTWIAVRGDLLRTRRDYLLTITELERVVGGSLIPEELS